MSDRVRLEAELENLERMLPLWRARLRHEAQFRPQFDVLANEILERADPEDRELAQERIAAMLAAHLPPASERL
ncbi:hypothetical protein DT603_12865 [Pseudoxanthomonas gei]|uniref:Uncharacterized protein n=1 Tax=Pseudoxanthomonas gei TaxID=1383030 RepID=A0ABX0ADS1_9GAMM|nr:hypothetical protein [Pseudoxanthomonas gei]NDK39734.1 hypothetical protein [Pseudoxanthomonas gei]